MALGVATERSSAIDYGHPWARTLPTPDGSITSRDRAHLLALYTGPWEPPSATTILEAQYADSQTLAALYAYTGIFEAQYADSQTLEVA